MPQFTYWPAVDVPRGQRFHATRERLVERFRSPAQTDNKLSLTGWSATTFRDNYRCLENVENCYAVGHDIEKGGTTLEGTLDALRDFAGFLHTTYSHAPDAPRLRAIVWTSRPIDADEYRRCWRYLQIRLERAGQGVDVRTSDPSRLWFSPGHPRGGEYQLVELSGALLDVDEALAEVPAERTEVTLPVEPIEVTTSVIERAQKYLESCEPAVWGQHGGTRTFLVAQKLVRGFQLDEDTAYRLMTDWNQRCKPPWRENGLRRKIHQAATCGTMEPGALLNATRGRAA